MEKKIKARLKILQEDMARSQQIISNAKETLDMNTRRVTMLQGAIIELQALLTPEKKPEKKEETNEKVSKENKTQ